MPIEKIFIATHKGDFRQARICIASIRYWYPDIPIFLIKDLFNGDFSTTETERLWNVGIYETEQRSFGWGMSKLEPVFKECGTRMLILDSDTVFTGRVLGELDQHPEDFVVHLERQPAQRINEIYFDLSKLAEFDPHFKFEGLAFNTGQYVATGGLLKRSEFEAVEWSTTPPSLKYPQIFKNGDQGVLNYVVLKKAAAGEITLAGAEFMRWPQDGIEDIDLQQLKTDSPYCDVIHWAGLSRPRLSAMIRPDILRFFEEYYYSRVSLGRARKTYRIAGNFLGGIIKKVRRRLTTAQPKLILPAPQTRETARM